MKPLSRIHEFKRYKINGELIYQTKPDIVRRGIKTDQLGLIFLTPPVESSSNGRVVYLLGDSVVYGSTVINHSLPIYLFDLLKKNGKFSVYSGGIPGYGTDQEFILFKKMLNYKKPDFVYWFINTNDVYDNFDRPLFVIRNNQLVQIPGFINGFYLQGLLLKIIPKSISEKSKLANFLLTSVINIKPIRNFDRNKLIDYSINKMRLQFEEMDRLSKKNDFKLVFVLSPRKLIVDNLVNNHGDLIILSKIKSLLTNKNYIDLNASFINYQFDNIDIEENILGINNSDSLFLDESDIFSIAAFHPSELGNYVMAKILSDNLQKEIFPNTQITSP